MPINVGDTTWMKAGGNVFVCDGASKANFLVSTVNSAVQFTGQFIGFQGDTAAGTTMSSSAVVIPGVGNLNWPYALDLLTAFTDSSGGTKSDTIASTIAKTTLTLPISLVGITGNSLAVAMIVPFAFILNSVNFRLTKVVSTAAKAATLTAQVNGSSVTGGAVALTSAGLATYGTVITGSAITAGNTGTAGQTVGVISSSVTSFSEGDGFLEFNVTNTDLSATLAAIAFKANQLRTALRHI